MPTKNSKSGGALRWWINLMTRWENSGLSAENFCIERNISYEKFLYWKSEIENTKRRSLASRNNTNELFVPVQVSKKASHSEQMTVTYATTAESSSQFEIILAGGKYIVRVNENFHSGRLYQLLAMLEQLAS